MRHSESQAMPKTNTGWDIRLLIANEAALQVARAEWEKESLNRPCLSLLSSKKDLDLEVLWFETTLGI